MLNLLYNYEFEYTEVIHENPKFYKSIFECPSKCNNFDKIITTMFKNDEKRNKQILQHHKKTTNKNKMTIDKTMLFDCKTFT